MAERKDRKARELIGRRARHLEIHPESKKVLLNGFELIVCCDKVCAKPRMTRSDVWKKRPIVERWLAYKDLIAMSYRSQGGVTFFNPVSVGYIFYLKDNRRIDLDNLIKGINDALNRLAWPDDDVKHIRQYDYARAVIDTSLEEERVKITIKPLDVGLCC